MATAPADREAAAHEVVSALSAVRLWLRETPRWLPGTHSTATLAALAALDEQGPCRVSDLAEQARLDVSVVSRHLQHLEREGLVARAPDPTDGRASRLQLTETGCRVLADHRAALDSAVASRLTDWNPDDLVAFAQTLRLLLLDLHEPERNTRS
jgi:DNA-binding MarR family transcriptional regulator